MVTEPTKTTHEEPSESPAIGGHEGLVARLLLETHWLGNTIPAIVLTYFISVSLPALESGRISQVLPDNFRWNPRGNSQKHECVCDFMCVCVHEWVRVCVWQRWGSGQTGDAYSSGFSLMTLCE